MTTSRMNRQQRVFKWVGDTFGWRTFPNVTERAIRLLEEVIETAQACDVDRKMVKLLTDRVYAKPQGDLRVEIGQVGVCILSLAHVGGLDADEREQAELERILSLPPDHFQKRHAKKVTEGLTDG